MGAFCIAGSSQTSAENVVRENRSVLEFSVELLGQPVAGIIAR